MMPELRKFEYTHSAEKARDTTLDDEKYDSTPILIECCNNTHHGAQRTSKQARACASDLGDGSHVTCLLSFFVPH